MTASGHVRVTGIVHAVVVVSDMERALGFYRDLLGLRVAQDFVHDPALLGRLMPYERPRVRAVLLKAPDGTEVELAEFRSPRGRSDAGEWPDAGIRSLTFRVEDLTGAVRSLGAAGVRFMSEPVAQPLDDGSVAEVVYCRGPDDVIVTLAQLPPGR
jgi:catechol 2,3-dioxygenase-like lactoylglutathione lyase family enzyme